MTDHMKMIRCDCSAADRCPQGKSGMQERCAIWRDERCIPDIVSKTGPREIIDPEYDTFGGPRPGAKLKWPHEGAHSSKHENVTDRLGKLEVSVTDMLNGLPDIFRRLREIDVIKARLAKMDEEAALNLVATDARLDRLSGMVSAVDNRVDHLSATVTDLLNLPGLATLNAAVVDINDRLDRFFTLKATAPRAIKGGWVNVYCPPGKDEVHGLPGSFVTAYPTREEADVAAVSNRIACIQIPDFNEGDGL